jgi:hypothetical protein
MSGFRAAARWLLVVLATAGCSLNPQVDPPSLNSENSGGGAPIFSGNGGTAGQGQGGFRPGPAADGSIGQGGSYGAGGASYSSGGSAGRATDGGAPLRDGATPVDAGPDVRPDGGTSADGGTTKDAGSD